MVKVVLESPYAGDVERNLEYARKCVRDSLLRGECPLASHLLYTQKGILDDNVPEERKLGIDAGLEWLQFADKHVFYVDHGMSSGMQFAYEKSIRARKDVEVRSIGTLEEASGC